MCAGSQLRDTQGEMLDVNGADISELEAGRGRINDNHGKGFFNCLGKVISAKKIMKAEDCEDDRQRYYWEKVKSPYVYVKAKLFNDEDHPNAKAAAAILRNIHKTDCPLKVKASVEGGVVSRGIKDPTLLAKTKIHSVALTFVPANQATLVEPLNLSKSDNDVEADMTLIKSVLHLAQTNVPSFRHITRTASAEKIEQNINKIMTALGKEVPTDLKQELIAASLERRIADNIVTINKLVKSAIHPRDLWNAAGGANTPHDHPSHEVLKDYWLEQGHAPDETGQLHVPNNLASSALQRFATWDKLHPNARPLLRNMDNTSWKHYTNKPVQPHELSTHPGIRADHDRAIDAANHVIHNHLPAFLDGHPELKEHVAALRALPTLKTTEDFLRAQPLISNAANAIYGVDENLALGANSNNRHWISDNSTKAWSTVDDAGHQGLEDVVAKGSDPVWNVTRMAQSAAQAAARAHHFRNNDISHVSKKLNNDVHDMLWNWAYPDVQKSLNAGYGGAGLPTDMTGGSVLQSESQEIGPKGLSFITCDDCGDEQVYGKFQVKCRKCNKAFSMNKLEKFFQTRRK